MEFVSEDQTWILRANSDLIGSKVTVELLIKRQFVFTVRQHYFKREKLQW
jgi:hypothetical protein